MKKEYNLQRKDVSTWDELFMTLSLIVETRSKDPNTQVGAIIVSKDNRILGTGYNGSPNGFPDNEFPWAREGDNLEKKYLYVVHAERNAILNFRGNSREFEGATLYVSMFPCNECAKEIIQVGIKKVIYLSDKYKDTDEVKASKIMFDKSGVEYIQKTEMIDDIINILESKINDLKKFSDQF